jgi:hypothetical protein
MRFVSSVLLTLKWRLLTLIAMHLETVSKGIVADVRDLMILICVDSLWKYEYGSD